MGRLKISGPADIVRFIPDEDELLNDQDREELNAGQVGETFSVRRIHSEGEMPQSVQLNPETE